MENTGLSSTYVTYPMMAGFIVTILGLSIFGVAWLVKPEIDAMGRQLERSQDEFTKRNDRAQDEVSRKLTDLTIDFNKKLYELTQKLEHDTDSFDFKIAELNAKLENGIRSKLDEAVQRMDIKFDEFRERFTAFQLQISSNRNRIQGIEEDPDGDGYRQKAPKPQPRINPED